jgi:hypothetical protein
MTALSLWSACIGGGLTASAVLYGVLYATESIRPSRR